MLAHKSWHITIDNTDVDTIERARNYIRPIECIVSRTLSRVQFLVKTAICIPSSHIRGGCFNAAFPHLWCPIPTIYTIINKSHAKIRSTVRRFSIWWWSVSTKMSPWRSLLYFVNATHLSRASHRTSGMVAKFGYTAMCAICVGCVVCRRFPRNNGQPKGSDVGIFWSPGTLFEVNSVEKYCNHV